MAAIEADRDQRMTLVEHLDELRKRMFKAALAIAVGTIIVFAQYNRVLEFLTSFYRDATGDPTKTLTIIDLTGSFGIRLKVAGYGGLYLSSPVWLYQAWKFITPGLRKKERQYAIPFVVSSVALFTAGGAIALLTLPQALKFLISYAGGDLEPLLEPKGYVGLVILMIVAFGICFEFPVVLVALQLAGVMSSRTLLKGWRYAIVIVVLIAAVATPSQDPFSLLAMAVPMWLLYFVAVGIGSSRRSEPRHRAGAVVSRSGPDGVRERFERSLPFDLDDFQLRALDALDEGASVVVAAPTGSGKTVVAEYAVERALAEGGKAFYTTPIKALSNQKYAELVTRHGSASVGLLTGDTALNERAPIVVMTTEVLRNMLYARAHALEGLRYVVLDEVHFLQDAYRGSVWEEVIINVAPEVDLVCLSATVSNADVLADWISSIRGTTKAVVHDVRPIELHQLHIVGDRADRSVHVLDVFVRGRPNPQGLRLDADAPARGATGSRNGIRRPVTPRRTEVVDELRAMDLLPALYFIFSRAGCDEAVRQLLFAGFKLTLPAERERIAEIVARHMEPLTEADRRALDHDTFAAALDAGIAAHHAGMVPAFREAVETCFVEGLVKVVFATETLALGINMPARTVVIEKLSKFTGTGHTILTPAEYTQLTGRAGRRGIDDVGHAATLWNPFTRFEDVAELAAQRTFELRSAFRPTFNMAANLVRRTNRERAHDLLQRSFAQFQLDADLVRTHVRAERLRRDLDAARADAACDRGDIEAYRAQQQIGRHRAPADRIEEIISALRTLRGAPWSASSAGRAPTPQPTSSSSAAATGATATSASAPSRPAARRSPSRPTTCGAGPRRSRRCRCRHRSPLGRARRTRPPSPRSAAPSAAGATSAAPPPGPATTRAATNPNGRGARAGEWPPVPISAPTCAPPTAPTR